MNQNRAPIKTVDHRPPRHAASRRPPRAMSELKSVFDSGPCRKNDEKKLVQRTNERTSERANERTNERTEGSRPKKRTCRKNGWYRKMALETRTRRAILRVLPRSMAAVIRPAIPLSKPLPLRATSLSPFSSCLPCCSSSLFHRGVDVNSRVQIPARSKFRTGN